MDADDEFAEIDASEQQLDAMLDEGEPVQIERRPSGTQVISARLPDELAVKLLAEVERRGVKISELVREAVTQLLAPEPYDWADDPNISAVERFDALEQAFCASTQKGTGGTARCEHMQIGGNIRAARCGMGCGGLPIQVECVLSSTWC